MIDGSLLNQLAFDLVPRRILLVICAYPRYPSWMRSKLLTELGKFGMYCKEILGIGKAIV